MLSEHERGGWLPNTACKRAFGDGASVLFGGRFKKAEEFRVSRDKVLRSLAENYSSHSPVKVVDLRLCCGTSIDRKLTLGSVETREMGARLRCFAHPGVW